jgi:hypothetical protein
MSDDDVAALVVDNGKGFNDVMYRLMIEDGMLMLYYYMMIDFWSA